MKLVKRQIFDRRDGKARDRVHYCISGQVWNRIRNQVQIQIWNKLNEVG